MTFVAQRRAPMHYAELALYLAPRLGSWLTGECLLHARAASVELTGRNLLGPDGVPARSGWWHQDSERGEVALEEMREGLILLGRVLCAWGPFHSRLQSAASAVAAWRCLLPPLAPLGARVGPHGCLAALALAVDPLDDELDAALAAALARTSSSVADQLLVYPALERLIETQPERLQRSCVGTLVSNSPFLLGLPTESWDIVAASRLAPPADLLRLSLLAKAPALFFHVAAELCHGETDDDERSRLELLLRVVGECEVLRSAQLRSTVSELEQRCRRFGIAIEESVWVHQRAPLEP